MFQFPGSAPLARWCTFSTPGCPIRTPADQFLFADPRSFSQLTTSFFASESLGIPHTPFLTSFRFTYVLVARYTLVYLKLFTTYFSTYFSSMSMNSLLVYSLLRFENGYSRFPRKTSNNAVISQFSISQCANCLLLPFSIFQFFINLVRLTFF